MFLARGSEKLVAKLLPDGAIYLHMNYSNFPEHMVSECARIELPAFGRWNGNRVGCQIW
jgi:hypothetical protein